MRRTMKNLLALSIALAVLAPLASLPAAAADSPGGWSAPVELGGQASFENGGPAYGQVAVAADGSAMSVWSQWIDSTSKMVVEYSIFDPSTGWSPVQLLYSYFGDDDHPAVAALPNGSFYMAYKQEGFSIAVVGGMWTPGKGWSNAQVISGTGVATDAYDIHLGADGSGNIHATWLSTDGLETNLTANRYTPSGGWGSATVIESNFASPFSTHLAVDDGGGATAVWVQNDGTKQRAFANHYSVGSGWGGSGTTIDWDSGLVNQVDVAAAADGEAVAVFSEVEGAVYRVSANVFTPGSGWSGPEFISVDPGTTTHQATQASIASSPGGQFAAVWHMGATSYDDLHTATYTTDGGWSSVHNITADENYAVSQRITVTSDGEAVVTYMAYPEGSTSSLVARSTTWDATDGWTASETIDSYGDVWVAIDCPATTAHCVAQVQLRRGSFSSTGAAFFDTPTSVLWVTLSAPTDGSTTQSPTVLVTGTTHPGNIVTVAGVAAVVTSSGEFAVQVPLVAGENEIMVLSTDGSGFAAFQTVTVTFDDPVAALTEDLDQAQSDLATAQSDLAQAQSDLAAANQEIERMKGDFSRLTDNFTATQQQLETVQASQSSQHTDVESASGSAGTAMMVGVLGLVVGLAAIAMAVMMGRKSGAAQAGAAAMEAPPKPPTEEGGQKP